MNAPGEKPSVKRVRVALRWAGSTAEIIALAATARSAREAADSLGVALGAIVKSLVFTVDGQPAMALVAGVAVAYAAAGEISRPVPGGMTISAVPIKASADVNRDLVVDRHDLMAVVRNMGSRPVSPVREDINHDGRIDVLDLAIVARYLGEEVPR